MSFVNIEVEGLEKMQQTFLKLAQMEEPKRNLVRAMNREAEAIMRVSRRLVPVVTGNLRASGTVEPPIFNGDEVSIAFGYGGAAARYAWTVHENPRAGKTGGFSPSGRKYYPRPGLPVPYSKVGQWKYLEQPWLAARARVLESIGAAISRMNEAR